jgi:hypothetical protein
MMTALLLLLTLVVLIGIISLCCGLVNGDPVAWVAVMMGGIDGLGKVLVLLVEGIADSLNS